MPDTTTTNYAFTKPEPGGSPGTWDGKLNDNWDDVDSELARPRIPHVSPTVGATTTLDLSLGRAFKFTVDETTTIAFSNVPANTFRVGIELLVTNGAAFVITWPASVTWLGTDTTPLFQASGTDLVRLVTYDGGTTWYGWMEFPLKAWHPTVFSGGGFHLEAHTQAGGLVKSRLGFAAATAPHVFVLDKAVSLTTTSTSEVSLFSYALPALAMITNGHAIRVTLFGLQSTQAGTVNVKFGATDHTQTVLANTAFHGVWLFTRLTESTQRGFTTIWRGDGSLVQVRASPAEDLTGAVTIDVRGAVTAGGTLLVDSVLIELLAA